MNKKVLCIIPTLNAEYEIEILIKRLLSQKDVLLDILIIDSSSTDNTVLILDRLNINHIIIDKRDFNHANTRNIALDYKADFYMFMTQDAIPYDDYLVKNLISSFQNDIVVSYARQIPKKDADLIETYARGKNYPEDSSIKSKNDLKTLGIKTFFSSDSCAMYEANYFKEVKGFTLNLNTNEDMEFAARAILNDKKIYYNADARVYHSHNFTFLDIWKRYKTIGVFFKNNKWILDEVNKNIKITNSGISQAIDEIKYLYKIDKRAILKSVVISFIKFLAFKIGNKF
ncbi:glycosyltransferase [Arcobacter sp. s6]|uniref:glycosyltransferase n=1 Tax=Arcobacter sp. s6 TaxID=3230363 RepID=UPI0034A08558